MAEGGTRAVAIHRVREGQRPLREVRHPLPPELLVAELAGELPPDVARAVREHVANCESCGARARTLAAPYDVIRSLGQTTVPYVPDLRRGVREQVSHTRFLARVWMAARTLGGGSLAGGLALGALAIVVSLFVVTSAAQIPLAAERSTNGAGAVPAAGAGGVLYAETNKMLAVQDDAGRTWLVAEVIAVDQRSGHVVRSLPANGTGMHLARAGEQPLATVLSDDGRTLFELTAMGRGEQALLAIDARTGALRFITPLTLPGGRALPADVHAVALTVAPDGQRVYVSLSLGAAGLAGPRVLVLSAGGAQVVDAVTPGMPAEVPFPAPSSGLPGVASTTPPQVLNTEGMRASLAAGGALVVSPDGVWLFDAVALTDESGRQDVVVRRIGLVDGATVQTLALPGNFMLSAMAGSANFARPLFYLARVGSNGQVYVLSGAETGPTLIAQMPLGGLEPPAGAELSGQVAISPTADSSQAYVSADVSVVGRQDQAHDIWLVDSASGTVASHRVAFLAVGQVLANWTGGSSGDVFELQGGQVTLLPRNLAQDTSPLWLRLGDGEPVIQLIGTGG